MQIPSHRSENYSSCSLLFFQYSFKSLILFVVMFLPSVWWLRSWAEIPSQQSNISLFLPSPSSELESSALTCGRVWSLLVMDMVGWDFLVSQNHFSSPEVWAHLNSYFSLRLLRASGATMSYVLHFKLSEARSLYLPAVLPENGIPIHVSGRQFCWERLRTSSNPRMRSLESNSLSHV